MIMVWEYTETSKIVLFVQMAYINILNQPPHNGMDLFRDLENSNKKMIKVS